MTGNSLPERPYAGTMDDLSGRGSVLIADKEVECAPLVTLEDDVEGACFTTQVTFVTQGEGMSVFTRQSAGSGGGGGLKPGRDFAFGGGELGTGLTRTLPWSPDVPWSDWLSECARRTDMHPEFERW